MRTLLPLLVLLALVGGIFVIEAASVVLQVVSFQVWGKRIFRIAPLSVLVDPFRALRVLGVEDGRKFSPKVTYVYRKQLEEADYIVVNKPPDGISL